MNQHSGYPGPQTKTPRSSSYPRRRCLRATQRYRPATPVSTTSSILAATLAPTGAPGGRGDDPSAAPFAQLVPTVGGRVEQGLGGTLLGLGGTLRAHESQVFASPAVPVMLGVLGSDML
jgi:hypothetical protein